MSDQKKITVNHIVVHKLDKEPHSNEAKAELSLQENQITEASQRLIDNVCGRYSGRPGKGYGCFEDDGDNYPMKNMVDDYLSNKDDFYQSSCRMMNHLTVRAQGQTMATGGYVLFADINMEQHSYMLVVILTATVGSTINNFSIENSTYLDIAKLRVAGRIDLTTYKTNSEQRYISFLKGKDHPVSGYFKQFLGCNDILIARTESEKLQGALKKFIAEQKLKEDEKESFLAKSHAHLQRLSKEGLPVDLEAFANEVWPCQPGILTAYLASGDLALSDGFVPDGRVIRGLIKFTVKSKFWELKFDRAAKVDGDIEYNKESKKIILNNVPDDFWQQLSDEV